jgi:hypothetical protein
MLSTFTQNRILRHLIFWVVVILFSSAGYISSPLLASDKQYAQLFWVNLLFEFLPTYVFFTYGLLHLVVPFLLKKRYVLSSVCFVSVGLLSVCLQKLLVEIDMAIIQPFAFGFTSSIPLSLTEVWPSLENLQDWVPFSYDFLLIGFVAAGIKFVKALMAKQAQNQRLKAKNLQTELKLIKAQINSHFLFHTLDHLYQLTLQHSKESPQVVLRLAHLMSYLLYESQAEQVPLEREVEMMENYIFLAQTHDTYNVDTALNISGDTSGKMIAPLVLLPFIENAFLFQQGVEQPWVSIQLSLTGSLMKFSVGNGRSCLKQETFEGIQKRLSHLYPGRYELKIIAEEEMLFAKLDLELNENNTSKLKPNNETTMLVSR